MGTEGDGGIRDAGCAVDPEYSGVLDRDGRLLRGWRLRWHRARRIARRLTRWWRPRAIMSGVDRDSGMIMTDVQRWSWTRWRWE